MCMFVGPMAPLLPKRYNPALTGQQMLGLRASLKLVWLIMGLPFGACIWVLVLHHVAQCKVYMAL